MDRMQKKCLMASASLHGFLVLLLVFGSAFFVAKRKDIPEHKLQFVPSKLIESALAGGGGNPNIARTDDVQQGSPDAPRQLVNPPALQPKPPQAAPTPPAPDPAPPEPTPEPRRTEPKVAAPKVAPKPASKKPEPKPIETAKPKLTDKPEPARPRIDLSKLKPVTRTSDDKRKSEAEEEAREQARQRNTAIASANAARQALAKKFGSAANDLQRGFENGTKVEVGGPGGEAYANYSAFVQAAYQDAWKGQIKLLRDLSDDDSVAVVRVLVSRDGRVVDARILERSPNSVMNRAVQRALDAVRQLPPFPPHITESERPFTIEFNLKTNRLNG